MRSPSHNTGALFTHQPLAEPCSAVHAEWGGQSPPLGPSDLQGGPPAAQLPPTETHGQRSRDRDLGEGAPISPLGLREGSSDTRQ